MKGGIKEGDSFLISEKGGNISSRIIRGGGIINGRPTVVHYADENEGVSSGYAAADYLTGYPILFTEASSIEESLKFAEAFTENAIVDPSVPIINGIDGPPTMKWLPIAVPCPDKYRRLLVFTPSEDDTTRYRLTSPSLLKSMTDATHYLIIQDAKGNGEV